VDVCVEARVPAAVDGSAELNVGASARALAAVLATPIAIAGAITAVIDAVIALRAHRAPADFKRFMVFPKRRCRKRDACRVAHESTSRN